MRIGSGCKVHRKYLESSKIIAKHMLPKRGIFSDISEGVFKDG